MGVLGDIAVDDVQWVDEASAVAIGFALRRVESEPVSFLFTPRTPEPLPRGLALPEPVERIEVGPLGLGATRRLVGARTGSRLSRQALSRVHEAAGGNPFFALELAGALVAAGGSLLPSGELPVPRTLMELLGGRLDALTEPAATAVLTVALAALPDGGARRRRRGRRRRRSLG